MVNVSYAEYLSNEQDWLNNFSRNEPFDKLLLLLENSLLKDAPYIKVCSDRVYDVLLTMSVLSDNLYVNNTSINADTAISLNKRAFMVLNGYLNIAVATKKSGDEGDITADEHFRDVVKDKLYDMVSFLRGRGSMRPARVHRGAVQQSTLTFDKNNQIKTPPSAKVDLSYVSNETQVGSSLVDSPSPVRRKTDLFQSHIFSSIEQNTLLGSPSSPTENKMSQRFKVFNRAILREKLQPNPWKLFEWGFHCGRMSLSDKYKNQCWTNYKPVLELVVNIMVMEINDMVENEEDVSSSLFVGLLRVLGRDFNWSDSVIDFAFNMDDYKVQPLYGEDEMTYPLGNYVREIDFDEKTARNSLNVATIPLRNKMLDLCYVISTKIKTLSSFFPKLLKRVSNILLELPLEEFTRFFTFQSVEGINISVTQRREYLIQLAEDLIRDLTSVVDFELPTNCISDFANEFIVDATLDWELMPFHEEVNTVALFHRNFQKLVFLYMFLLDCWICDPGLDSHGENRMRELVEKARIGDERRRIYFKRVISDHKRKSQSGLHGFFVSEAREAEILSSEEFELMKLEQFLRFRFGV